MRLIFSWDSQCAGGQWVNSVSIQYQKRVPLWLNSTEAYYETQYLDFGCSSQRDNLYLSAGNDALYPWSWVNTNSAYQQFPNGFTNMTLP